jgi:hypothetical protein
MGLHAGTPLLFSTSNEQQYCDCCVEYRRASPEQEEDNAWCLGIVEVNAWVLKYHPSVKPKYDKTPMRKENNPQTPWRELCRRIAWEICP